ncbi:UDP-N-acetylmuramoyl-L-alanyl-D-glutamate--2,6-diaminopimelate ligase [Thalassomonas sp. M1454]|uniref:UDP-N-acetylmuramoyl-L-alanyl-D-glutamate--2, 6-diaminopimelate ligase n=1 Tax=Thalassomonas sp. M1454 TaxID=2594477 RepID=UPI00163DBBE9|nr:UDP-N-acetylmuramoyl-L-alanyl-D-glutamate--2,6-diaminopimelate ligase [Thalassomonas sp. M1454]
MPNIHSSTFSISNTLACFDINISDVATNNLVNDSRDVQTGDVFAAVSGTNLVGSDFIDKAIAQGASLVLSQCAEAKLHGSIEQVASNHSANGVVTIVHFYQLDKQLAKLSAIYYNQPVNDLTLVGITGTNGKTSCCQIMAQLMNAVGKPTAIIGTLGAGTLDNLVDINNTTPGPTKLQNLLAQFKAQNIKQVAMEVSSHALSQHRVESDMIDIAVFTNLTRDHLDYHGDMQSYGAAKRALFNGTKEQVWVLNADDAQTHQWLTELAIDNERVLYSCNANFDQQAFVTSNPNAKFINASNIKCHNQGVDFALTSSWGNINISSGLLGEFNVSNLLAAIAVLLVQGVALEDIAKHTKNLTAVAGRMETFSAPNLATTVVDYAHTPDGLEKALTSARKHCQGKLWAVFGCGGDRDTGKRAVMGAIAEQYADQIVLTNDNPRTEDPNTIIADIAKGIKNLAAVTTILDREQAIISTLKQAGADDMVLCAGKGHEDYTIIGTEKIAYYEREVVRKLYQQVASL